jgi:hypothetical protein
MAAHPNERGVGMSNRQEFDKPTRRAIILRSTVDGRPHCEWVDESGVRCVCDKGLELAHLDLDAMKSDEAKRNTKLTEEDGRMLCKPHHRAYDEAPKADFAKSNHVRDRALGVAGPKRGWAKVSREKPPLRVANGRSEINRRYFDE